MVPDFVTLLRWPFGAQVKRGLRPVLTCAPNGHLRRVTNSGTRCCIDTIKSSWRWALYCSKHVEEHNRFNKEIVHQVGKQNYILLRCAVSSTLKKKRVPEMFRGVKGGRCLRLETWLLSCADCLEIWEPEPPGTLRACPGICLPCFASFGFVSRPSSDGMFNKYIDWLAGQGFLT